MTDPKPLDMVIHCPRCGDQHIDEPDPETGWTNPPHKSHLCLSCGVVWRVADVPTNGVAATQTQGTDDNWFPPLALAVGCTGEIMVPVHVGGELIGSLSVNATVGKALGVDPVIDVDEPVDETTIKPEDDDRRMPCTHPHVVRQVDEVFCSDCGSRWDYKDPDAPECV